MQYYFDIFTFFASFSVYIINRLDKNENNHNKKRYNLPPNHFFRIKYNDTIRITRSGIIIEPINAILARTVYAIIVRSTARKSRNESLCKRCATLSFHSFAQLCNELYFVSNAFVPRSSFSSLFNRISFLAFPPLL